MLLKTLKANSTYYYFLIPIIALALWSKSIIDATVFPFFPDEEMMILYRPLNYLLGQSALANTITALIFTILLSFLIMKLNVQYAFIRVRTFLSPILFILISSGMHQMHAMHPVYPAALFLILTIDRIFDSYEKEIIHSNAFDAGIFLAIGSLFYLNLVFFFPFLWIGLVTLKPKVNWRDYILSALGFLFPWLAALAYYFITNQTDELVQLLKENISFHQVFFKDNLAIQIYIGYLILLTIFGSFFLIAQYDEKKISSRKYFKAFFWIFLISDILILANPAISQEIIVIFAIPLCYLISNFLIFMKRQIWGEVLLYLLSAGVIYLQFI